MTDTSSTAATTSSGESVAVATIIANVAAGLTFIEALAPIASGLGPVGATAATVAEAVASFAMDLLNTYQADQAALSSEDVATIKALVVKTQAANDKIAAIIAAS